MVEAVNVGQKFVHFDLKGAPPKLPYLYKVIAKTATWGATGILMEYEDMFPFHGSLSHLKTTNAYSSHDITTLLKYAAQHKLEVIPLIQTMGHLEFALKHDQHRKLREMEAYPNAICPSHPEVFEFITSAIQQVIEAHPNSSYIHIGGDEVWHLGKCSRCTEVMANKGFCNADLYLNWICRISQWIKRHWPDIRILVWDDMFRDIALHKLKEYNLQDIVEPMIWKYESTEFKFPVGMFERYREVFTRIWTASAYKGASGSAQTVPPVQFHINNQLVWVGVINHMKKMGFEVQGIVITGWQRYDHYAVLCELLPVSLPCLALCLQVLTFGAFTEQIHANVSSKLGFQELINVTHFPRPQAIEVEDAFPGHQLFDALQMFANTLARYHAIINSESVLGWFNEYLRVRKFTNPVQVEGILYPLLEIRKSLSVLDLLLSSSMEEIFFQDTVEEWFGCFFTPLLKKIEEIILQCNEQLTTDGREVLHRTSDQDKVCKSSGNSVSTQSETSMKNCGKEYIF